MKAVFSSLLLVAGASAHTIFQVGGLSVHHTRGHWLTLVTLLQRLSVNGADQGYLTGVRAPDSDYVGPFALDTFRYDPGY